jgi:hypothetical protein
MTREQFLALPTHEQLWEIYEAVYQGLYETESSSAPAPRGNARAPKYDGQLRKKAGMAVWMSEMLRDDLEYWRARNEADSKSGEFAESNAKMAKILKYWVEYRDTAPTERWTGLRGDDVVTAAAPSREPATHVFVKRGDAPAPAPAAPAFGSPDDDDSIPF